MRLELKYNAVYVELLEEYIALYCFMDNSCKFSSSFDTGHPREQRSVEHDLRNSELVSKFEKCELLLIACVLMEILLNYLVGA